MAHVLLAVWLPRNILLLPARARARARARLGLGLHADSARGAAILRRGTREAHCAESRPAGVNAGRQNMV
jgi:hypothetical protein